MKKLRKQLANYNDYLRKKIHYAKDILPESKRKRCDATLERLAKLDKTLDSMPGEKMVKELDAIEKEIQRLFPSDPVFDIWFEYVEMAFVAIVIALGLRTYFMQPFKIPTHSMRPTLYGVTVEDKKDPLPNSFVQIAQYAAYGIRYFEARAKTAGRVEKIQPSKLFGLPFYDCIRIRIGGVWHTVPVNESELELSAKHVNCERYRKIMATYFNKGDVILRVVRHPGDHVFVNKMAYHFGKPRQGQVFVFNTKGIPKIQDNLLAQGIEGSQYYIKRCVGAPGNVLRIDPPYLYSDGIVLKSSAFDRVHSRKNEYRGYSAEGLLDSPDRTYSIGKGKYWAMGDNSYSSFDSRYWGPVDNRNLVGAGWFVYWPFGKRWGFID
jgi:signal peptidase I